ncbi:hypothetical protein VN24_16730 [Paenibacillus beijingensis]|uniref:Uncharacterized protein n=2 Tax=Paenibacillus beijingensis TaxID=1126833 RepID=A0A0D5NR92_9BACL|nr:hypothetical protein VN24_16730 [Paenibacillus beijingensis]
MIVLFLMLMPLTGCWNAVELDQWGFVQGIAIDTGKNNMIELTVQFYKPGGEESGGKKGGGSSGGGETVNLKTRDASVFEAIRDITIHLGRKAQWSHMRVIIIGEDLAKKTELGDILDFFMRDHEPRPTVAVAIGQGKAARYLTSKPFLESSMGMQLRKSEKMSHQFAGKTLRATLMDLAHQLKNETQVVMMPFIYFDPKSQPFEAAVTGLMIVKNGKMVQKVPPNKIEGLLMLIDKYQGGIIQVPCSNRSKEKVMEAIEVDKVKTKFTVKTNGESISGHALVSIDGYAGALSCSSLETSEEVEQFNKKAAATVQQKLQKVALYFQQQKLDVFGIGDRIFRKNPALWSRLKPEWEDRVARIPINISVKVNTYNNGVDGVYFAWGFPNAELVLFSMLLPFVKREGKHVGRWMFTMLLVNGISLTIVIVCTIMGLGQMTGIYKYSLFSLARLIEVRDFIERIESIPGMALIAGSYMKATIVLYITSLGISQLFRINDYRILVFPVAMVALLLSLTMFTHEVEFMEFVNNVWPLLITLTGVIPILVLTLVTAMKSIKKGTAGN